MPAPLLPKKYNEVLSLAKKAHKILKCRGITRSDFRFFKNNFYLLETNTQPGMTKLSLVPEIANYYGIKFEDLLAWMIKPAPLDGILQNRGIKKLMVRLSFRGIPDLPRKKTQQEEIEEQGERIVNQSVEVKQQTKEVKDMIDDESSK